MSDQVAIQVFEEPTVTIEVVEEAGVEVVEVIHPGPQGQGGEESVQSVNGQTGAVVLDAADVGAEPLGAAAAAVAAHVAAADPHPSYTTAQEAAAAAPVQSVSLSAPSGWSASTASINGNVTLTLGLPTGYSLPSNASQGQWDIAYAERTRWDGSSTGLNAATGRTSLGLGSAATAATTDFATAAQGAKADTAVQPAGLISGLAGKADLVGGLVPASQLPGFVDDVLEFANVAAFPATGEAGKLYISLATNRAYRWSGSIYVEINPSPGSTDAVPEGSVNLYFTTARGETAAASWWASSAAASKLAGIASGATANASNAELRDRATHTGTQAASTITGLATVATSGAYSDLSGRPTLFDPASPGAIGGTAPGAGSFTSLTASTRLGLPSGAPASPAARDLYAVSDTLRYRDSSGTERLILNATDNLANLANAATARTNLGLGALTPDGSSNLTFSARWIQSTNGAASAPAYALTGTWFTGGTATTTKPQFLIEPAGTTSASWPTSGTGFGVNAPGGFLGDLAWFGVNGTAQARILSNGAIRWNTTNTPGFSPLPSGFAFNLFNGGANIFAYNNDVAALTLSSGIEVAWNNIGDATNPVGRDLRFFRGGPGIIAQRNGANSQAYWLFNRYTSDTSFERLNIRWASDRAIIDTQAGSGGGTLRGLNIGSAATSLLGFFGAEPVAQPAAVANATDAASAVTQLNLALARLRALGLIAT